MNKGINIDTSVKATIDELNQYLEGNVTRLGLILSLQELINEL